MNSATIGRNLRKNRLAQGVKQQTLAKMSAIPRFRIIRFEKGQISPRLPEAVQLAAALCIPLDVLTIGQWNPPLDLPGLALELHHYGIRDLAVAAPIVPGSFRRVEQVIAAALQGDRPEPRVVEALPALLVRQHYSVSLLRAFATCYDKRVVTRLAWLSDVTLVLVRQGSLPMKNRSQLRLDRLRRVKRPAESDDLGHPGKSPFLPAWKRWNITYAGDLADFKHRLRDVEIASQSSIRPETLG